MGKKSKWTAKERLFVKAYFSNGFNASAAARDIGMSEKSAATYGSELVRKPHIAAAIEKEIRKRERILEMDALCKGVTQARWLEEVAKIAFTSIDDVAVVRKGALGSYVDVLPTAKRDGKFGSAVKKLSETKNGLGIELHSKQSALELLARSYGWVKDKHEHTGKDGKDLPASPVVIMLPPKNSEPEE